MTTVDLDALRNDGCVLLHDVGEPAATRTLVVLGAPRGGTSMVAAVLAALGINMGPRLSAVYEDTELATPLERGDNALFAQRVAERNARHACWGFKRPSALGHLAQLETVLRNPEYLFVFRDPLAIAQRNHLSVGSDVLEALSVAQAQNAALVAAARTTRRRSLLISYEKALMNQEAFVARVGYFCDRTSAERLESARRAIQPGAEAYLLQARDRGFSGRLERATPKVISGWATCHGSEAPVQVELLVNDQRLAVVLAGRPRADVARAGRHATGRCGFLYSVPPEAGLTAGYTVRARVLGAREDLNNSPLVARALTAGASRSV